MFAEDSNWYGTCLELNITESGDTPREALLLLFEAVQGYLESAEKINARPYILNQKTDPEYETMWSRLKERRKILAKEVFTFGNLNIGRQIMAPV